MAHFPKPFFRKDRGLWYVQLEKQINLGPDRDEAFRQYGELIAKPRPTRLASNSVAVLMDLFLDWMALISAGTTPASVSRSRSAAPRSTDPCYYIFRQWYRRSQEATHLFAANDRDAGIVARTTWLIGGAPNWTWVPGHKLAPLATPLSHTIRRTVNKIERSERHGPPRAADWIGDERGG